MSLTEKRKHARDSVGNNQNHHKTMSQNYLKPFNLNMAVRQSFMKQDCCNCRFGKALWIQEDPKLLRENKSFNQKDKCVLKIVRSSTRKTKNYYIFKIVFFQKQYFVKVN